MSRRINRASDENNLVFNDVTIASTSGTSRLQTEDPANHQPQHGVTPAQLPSSQSTSEQQAPPDAALTQTGRARQRRKWTTEINEKLLRAYYQVTLYETDLTGYRPRLHQMFTSENSDYNVSEQRLSDQIRVIHRNNLISEPRRNTIKEEMRAMMNNMEDPEEDDSAPTNDHESNGDDNQTGLNQQTDETEQNQESINEVQQRERTIEADSRTRETFANIYSLYEKTNPNSRPPIPKVNSSHKTSSIIADLNEKILPPLVATVQNIEELQTITYCAAITTAIRLGKKVNINPNNEQPNQRPRRSSTKPWLKRVDKTINELRSNISKIENYTKNGRPSRRNTNKVKKICKNYNKHSKYETNDELPHRTLDTLKQKLSVQVQKRKKYLTSEQRKENNKTFHTNEKKFYRNLKQPREESTTDDDTPSIELVQQYWSGTWTSSEEHRDAGWVDAEKVRQQNTAEMQYTDISEGDLKTALARAHNWKSPGPDRIQNFWYKRLTCLHAKLATLFTECLNQPTLLPTFLTQGTTYLLPKGPSFQGDPAKGRPITCLNTMYKILTACLSNAIYHHLTENNIMAEEQKGCVRGAKGCKEQLTVDQVILEQATKNSRNLFACYIDYQKCFDSLPHSWLLETLRIYKVSPSIINLLTSCMQHWRTVIEIPARQHSSTGAINSQQRPHRTDPIPIKKGIYQGDCLSALWFCMALNPLSSLLRTSNIGFQIKTEGRTLHKINHLIYMDDLKLYASTKNHINELIQIVADFSRDIRMNFGIDKCRTLNIRAGKISLGQEPAPMLIPDMDTDEYYKYLGVMQSRQIAHSDMRKKLTTEFKSRLYKLIKAKLNGKNLVKAINTYAIPVITYSFGVVKWSPTELKNLQRTIRTTMTKFNLHHPKSCMERMTLPRRLGGRGITDIELLHDNQVVKLRQYFQEKAARSELVRSIVAADDKHTPLNLSANQFETSSLTPEEKENVWAGKSIHGRYHHALNDTYVDKEMSNKWLRDSGIFAETEGFMIAIQDEVIATRNYVKHVMKLADAPEDRCRRCGAPRENIDHITSGCPTLAQTEYLRRHNNVAKIVHIELLKHYKIKEAPPPYYEYNPEPVVETNEVKIYYDRTIHTVHGREHNRPDITIIDKKNKAATLVDVTIPLSRNMTRARQEKLTKYSELAIEVKTMWNLNSVRIVPIIISSVGLIPTTLREDLASLHLKPGIIKNMQKAVIIDTCHTVRKFIQ